VDPFFRDRVLVDSRAGGTFSLAVASRSNLISPPPIAPPIDFLARRECGGVAAPPLPTPLPTGAAASIVSVQHTYPPPRLQPESQISVVIYRTPPKQFQGQVHCFRQTAPINSFFLDEPADGCDVHMEI
jgi:hypothetical protein